MWLDQFSQFYFLSATHNSKFHANRRLKFSIFHGCDQNFITTPSLYNLDVYGGPTCIKVPLNNYIFHFEMFSMEQNTKRDTREDQHAKRCFSIINLQVPNVFNRKEQRGAERSGSERCGAEQNAKRGPTCIKVPLNNYIFHFEMFSMERSEGERKRTQKEIQGRTHMQKGVSQ